VLLSVDRIGGILNEAPEASSDTGLVLPSLQDQVSFDQLFFRYQPDLEDGLCRKLFKVTDDRYQSSYLKRALQSFR